ncbi:MAG: dihydrofolate reductase [Euryarchaeota archaeon]|nr:dihydrofolate reductase [Euryarchaeota archaeon]|tara:strand:+ start:5049 stop:5543 length:495 start_codon:yes stop_codon:yes gene_type:complete
MEITLIAAFDNNQAIGKEGDLPWRLSSDLKHFKKITTGNTIVMGRKTFDSIGRALPNRKNVVLTRNKNWKNKEVITINHPDEIISICKNENEVFIIGGAEIYEVFLKIATKMILSLVDTEVEFADAFFPDFEDKDWEIVKQSKVIKEENDDFFYKIVTFKKLLK